MGRKPNLNNLKEDGDAKVHQSIYFRIRDKKIYGHIYPTLTYGLSLAANSWIPLRLHTIREIRNIGFSRAEIKALVDHLRNIPMKDPVHMIEKEMLLIHVLNSQEWNNLEVAHGISYDDLVYKINKMTAAQVFFLQAEIALYWFKKPRRKLDEFIDTFF
jgi:DNA-binding transcriptional MerR regulator